LTRFALALVFDILTWTALGVPWLRASAAAHGRSEVVSCDDVRQRRTLGIRDRDHRRIGETVNVKMYDSNPLAMDATCRSSTGARAAVRCNRQVAARAGCDIF
jgi:hypothetical protein